MSLTTDELRQQVATILSTDPRAMTPVMARQLGVPEVEVLRAFPAELVTEMRVEGERMLDLLRSLEQLGRVHVIASNEGCTLEAYGYFGGFSVTGPFFNVQTDTIDMHIRHQALVAAFALIKPSHQDGQTTYSIQFFTKSGTAAFKVFLYKSVTEKDGSELQSALAAWERLRAEFGG